MDFGTGSEDLKLAKLIFFTVFDFAVEALVAEDALSDLRDVVALLIFLDILLFSEPSRRRTLLLWSLPDVEELATDPTLVLVEILLAFSLISEFFDLDRRVSGSHTDLDLMAVKFSRRLKAVGTRRIVLFVVSSSLSLLELGSELNDESTIGSTLEILSQRFRIGSAPSESFTFSKEEIMGSSIGGNLKSLLVEVE